MSTDNYCAACSRHGTDTHDPGCAESMASTDNLHRTYQGQPHSDCKCEACMHWYPVLFDKNAELDQLHRWKIEATTVIAEWEQIFEALGKPGTLGQSKAEASLAEIRIIMKEP